MGTGVAHVVMSVAAGRPAVMRASGTTFLIPAVALFLGVAVRGERVAPLSVAGSMVCIAGAWLMRRARKLPSHREASDALSQQLAPRASAGFTRFSGMQIVTSGSRNFVRGEE